MKLSELKKALKSSVATVRIAEAQSSGTFQAAVQIYDPSKEFDQTLLILEAQANDLTAPDVLGRSRAETEREPANRFRTLAGVGGFYAVHVETEVRYGFAGFDMGYKDPARATAIVGLVRKLVAERNLAAVYPECASPKCACDLPKRGKE